MLVLFCRPCGTSTCGVGAERVIIYYLIVWFKFVGKLRYISFIEDSKARGLIMPRKDSSIINAIYLK
jgi:hypothetical protein